MPFFYRIRDWSTIYENNRTRELKSMLWIPIPVNLSGDGYCQIMEDKKYGPAIFGSFIAMVELAACCKPRGDLLRSTGEPHDFASIGRICRIDGMIIEKTLKMCIEKLKWVQIIDLNTDCDVSAQTCGEGAVAPSLPTVLCNTISSINSKRSKIFIPPTFEEVKEYCKLHGFENIAEKVFNYYNDANPPWTDSKRNKVLSWKSKLQSVWFREEDKDKPKPVQQPKQANLGLAYLKQEFNA